MLEQGLGPSVWPQRHHLCVTLPGRMCLLHWFRQKHSQKQTLFCLHVLSKSWICNFIQLGVGVVYFVVFGFVCYNISLLRDHRWKLAYDYHLIYFI